MSISFVARRLLSNELELPSRRPSRLAQQLQSLTFRVPHASAHLPYARVAHVEEGVSGEREDEVRALVRREDGADGKLVPTSGEQQCVLVRRRLHLKESIRMARDEHEVLLLLRLARKKLSDFGRSHEAPPVGLRGERSYAAPLRLLNLTFLIRPPEGAVAPAVG
eukprot:CAMPEP_0113283226 /NCGR_PEP_ID=MMETSP0008_2-20120614/29323_1 /TAXON_ID=97485 /ORGANISM="Prymnesium parvum" /LENGTH=164 /DNA_ID=CAMNT_0000133899 /DNA_START=104 /DNA_END=595 /DNA_ORIENTATION=+ /assembly_acc=CAM_ASM_000153